MTPRRPRTPTNPAGNDRPMTSSAMTLHSPQAVARRFLVLLAPKISASNGAQSGRAIDVHGRAADIRPHRRDNQRILAIHQKGDTERGRNAPRAGWVRFVVGEAGERRLHRAVDLDPEIAAGIAIAGGIGVGNV